MTPTVLIIDPEPDRSEAMERALSVSCRTEVARNAAGAFEILSLTVVDAIVADSGLEDMDWPQLRRRLESESRFRDIPFVMLMEQGGVEERISAFQTGVDECLIRPVDPAELKARIDALVRKRRRAIATLRERRYQLAGDFTGLAFPDLISILDQGRHSGVLSVFSPRSAGRVVVQSGRIIHATFGNLQGSEAFYLLMRQPQGQFEFAPGLDPADAGVRTIERSSTALLMEGSRLLDTSGVDHHDTDRIESVRSGSFPTVMPPAPHPDADLFESLSAVLSDPLMLGELRYLTAEQLISWTGKGSGGRIHCVLIGELQAGIDALLANSAPPSAEAIVAGTEAATKTVAWTFTMRDRRSVDCVLIDVRAPAAMIASLHRQPCLAVIAPPGGDGLAITESAHADLRRLLRRLQPAALLGVGNASLEGVLSELAAEAGSRAPWRCRRGALGEAGQDLRDLLLEGLWQWAQAA